MGKPQQDELTPFAEAVRDAYLTPPDEATEARHLAAMAAEARLIDREPIPVRSRRGTKEAVLVNRFRTATLAFKLGALTLLAAFMTGGLATAGVIDLPDSLPGAASDRATAVHDAIDGADPSETTPGSLIEPGEDAASAEGRRQNGSASEEDIEARQNGATPEEGAGQAFGDSVSDRASGGEPQEDGREFGESVSEEAQQLVPRPSPQPEGGPETGETQSQAGPETGETQSQAGRDIAEGFGGGPPQD